MLWNLQEAITTIRSDGRVIGDAGTDLLRAENIKGDLIIIF